MSDFCSRTDCGARTIATKTEMEIVSALRREVASLRQANLILRLAAAANAAEDARTDGSKPTLRRRSSHGAT